jgi:hypothetical protein
MTTPLELAARRRALVARSTRLRDVLQGQLSGVRDQVQGVDRGVSFARSLLKRPVVLTAATALLVALRPARALRWAARGALALSLARKAMGLLALVKAARR